MPLDGFTLVGGSLRVPPLTSKLNEKDYAIGKTYAWLSMLKNRQQPRKWMKPSSKGTNVNFDIIMNESQLEEAQDEFELYLKKVNRDYGTEFELTRHRPKALVTSESSQPKAGAESGIPKGR